MRAILTAFSLASLPPSVKKLFFKLPGVISASNSPKHTAWLGGRIRVHIRELVELIDDGVNHPLIAVANVHAHQLAVEIQIALAVGVPEIHAFGMVYRQGAYPPCMLHSNIVYSLFNRMISSVLKLILAPSICPSNFINFFRFTFNNTNHRESNEFTRIFFVRENSFN